MDERMRAVPLAPVSLALLASLYTAQGLPSGLIAHALPALLRDQGVDLALIGLLKLLALPWLLKAIWAPWVDRLSWPRLGHHRGWILPLQGLTVVCLVGLALLPSERLFGEGLSGLLLVLALINLAMATQDIATDGLAVRLLPESLRGVANSLQVGGYKVGMLLSGSGLLMVYASLGWQHSLLVLATLVALLMLPVLFFPERRLLSASAETERDLGPALLLRHYRGFLLRPGMGLWLLVLLTFKLGDALGSPMIKPMLSDQGWALLEIGRLTLFSTLAGIAGALLGGLLYTRLGAGRSLLAFGVLQALGIAGMALLVGRGAETGLVYAVALFEQTADGMSSVALFAAMMRLCRPAHEGADFTVQASLQLLLAGLVGSSSGLIAKSFGYPALFIAAGVLGLVMLGLVLSYFRHEALTTSN
jgi:MFS family permease